MSHPMSIYLLPLPAKLLVWSIFAVSTSLPPFFQLIPTGFYPYHSTTKTLISQNNHWATSCQSQILCSPMSGTHKSIWHNCDNTTHCLEKLSLCFFDTTFPVFIISQWLLLLVPLFLFSVLYQTSKCHSDPELCPWSLLSSLAAFSP